MTQKYQVKVSMKQAAIVETGIVLKQGDFGMQIEIEVLDFDVTGTTPQIVFRKAMGAVESTTITVFSNKYTYTFKGTELDTPGKVFCDLKLKNSTTQRISTASFMFSVVADTMDGLAEEASSYSDTIDKLLGKKVNNPLDINDNPIYGTLGQGLRTLGNGETEWADIGLPTDEQTEIAVTKWLNDHPEATTTVQDRSITEAKFTNELSLKTLKDYVTPEMFGAEGDGINDDTISIKRAIATKKPILFTKHYRCTDSFDSDEIYFTLTNNSIIELDNNVDCFISLNSTEGSNTSYNCYIEGAGTINGNFKCNTLIGVNRFRRFNINQVYLKNFNVCAVNTRYTVDPNVTKFGAYATVKDLLIRNEQPVLGSIGINDTGADNFFENVEIQDVEKGVRLGGSSAINIHHWLSEITINELFTTSVCISIRNNYGSRLINCVSDTVKIGIYIEQEYASFTCVGFEYFHSYYVIDEATLSASNICGIYSDYSLSFCKISDSMFDFRNATSKMISDALYTNIQQGHWDRIYFTGLVRGKSNTENIIPSMFDSIDLAFLGKLYATPALSMSNDFDTVIHSGVYWVDTYHGSGGQNYPIQTDVGMMFVCGRTDAFCFQLYLSYEKNKILFRVNANNNWSVWREK